MSNTITMNAPVVPAPQIQVHVEPLIAAPALVPVQAPEGVMLSVKHALGRAIAGLALLLLAPLMLTLALLVKLSSPGPVLYRQRRVGQDGRRFDMLKFRSMRPGTAAAAFVPAEGLAPGGIEGVDRRTAIGKIMRRTSLDELPQLLNVVLGDMVLVGPRPERPEFVERFADEVPGYADRHRVRPGMTGLAQVRGLRGKTSIVERAAADIEYIRSWSLLLDVKVLLLTFRAVLQPAE